MRTSENRITEIYKSQGPIVVQSKVCTRFKTNLRPAKIQYCYLLKDFNRKALMSRVSKSFKIYLTTV